MSGADAILFVADDQKLSRRFEELLTAAGYSLDVVAGEGAALARLRARPYAVVVIDQQNEELAGAHLLERVLGSAVAPPVIVLTSPGNEQLAALALKMGASDYLVKDGAGHFLQRLPRLVERMLRERQALIEREQLLSTLQRRNRALHRLNRAGQSLSGLLEREEILDQLLAAATGLVGAEGGSVWMWDEDDPGWLVCQANLRHDRRPTLVNLRLHPGQGVAGRVAEEGVSVVISDVSAERAAPGTAELHAALNTTSLMAVPLKVRDTILGVLEIANKRDGRFSGSDCHLVETLAASAATALDNARLFRALREQTSVLQAQNEALDAFAHMVAHDLQTPLGQMMGFVDLLATRLVGETSDDIGHYLRTLQASGQTMSRIIDELLFFASVPTTGATRQSLPMGDIVARVVERLAPLIDAHDAVVTRDDAWPVAVGHAPWVEEIWANYLSNALRYGGRPPIVHLGAERAGDGVARFWVHDNGRGLTADEQSALFIPFSRLKRDEDSEGHGLGLSIVRRILDRLDGEADVVSAVGQGTTFRFTLPMATAVTEAGD